MPRSSRKSGARERRASGRSRRRALDEQGQSLVEIAVGAPFLIILVIVLIEMGIVFAVYISLINAAREGAVFASKFPQLSNGGTSNTSQYSCPDASCPTLGEEFGNRIANEVFVEPGETLRGRQLIDTNKLTIDTPVLGSTVDKGNAITVTVNYTVNTFTSSISMPFFGRFGLPSAYILRYSMAMPIR